MNEHDDWEIHNPQGRRRVIVTKSLPGERWLERLQAVDARVEVCTDTRILHQHRILEAIGSRCDAAIGQLTERWDATLFEALAAAGGRAYSNYAVGFDNVDVAAATRSGIPVGNTPGVLTHATAEMAATLTLAAARRVVPADRHMRSGQFEGWLPTLFMGEQLRGKTLGLLGAGRIGRAYARIMVEGFGMHLSWYDPAPLDAISTWISALNRYRRERGEIELRQERTSSVEQVLSCSDVVSLHMPLTPDTHHLLDATRLALMKPNAVLVNTSRGPVVDEAALVRHCERNPQFRAGLDVFEEEPRMKPGLEALENVVIVPHIASATVWTREAMATLAATNVAGLLSAHPAAPTEMPVTDFLQAVSPALVPSVVNPEVLQAGG